MKRFAGKIFAAAVLLVSASVVAAPLDDRVPNDALVYAGWRGADSMAGEYAQSNLKGVVETAGMRAYIQQQLPHWIELAGEKDPSAPEQINDLLSGLNIAWHHACALYIGPMDLGAGNGPPKPRIALLCDAGADAPALMALLQKVQAKTPPSPDANLAISQDGSVVIVTLGVSTAEDFKVHADALRSADAYKKALTHVSPTAAVTLFADPPAVINMIDTAMAAERNVPPAVRQKYEAVMKALGLRNLGQLVFGAGFQGKGWTEDGFVAITGPRTGLLSLTDSGALDETALAAVPNDAYAFQAERFDLAKLLATVRSIAGDIDPEVLFNLNNGIEAAGHQLGFDLEKEFLAALGDQWVSYRSPSPDGVGLLQTFVMKVKDAKSLESSLKAISAQIGNMSQGKVTVDETDVEGIHVTEFHVTMLTIAWTLRGDYLYVSSAAGIPAAVNQVEKNQPSILTNQSYLDARAKLPKVQPSALSYSDPSKIYPEEYRTVATLLPFLGALGVNIPVTILPNPVKSAPFLTPGASEMWTTEEGVHFKSVGSIPGAE
ncbi:MAG: hypothetical protein ACTHN5_19650 [Phycisphaerae bacterium]